MRLLTYNIHKGVGTDRRYRLDRVVGVIAAEAPDLICLQEVDRNVRRSRYDDQPALLVDRLGAKAWMYQLNSPRGEGGYGNLLLSRWPFLKSGPLVLRHRWRIRAAPFWPWWTRRRGRCSWSTSTWDCPSASGAGRRCS